MSLQVNASSWLAAYPIGLKNLMIYIKDVYKNPVIYITENGIKITFLHHLEDKKEKTYLRTLLMNQILHFRITRF